jgi:hypothetical protein
MPVKVTLAEGKYAFIRPTDSWKTIAVKGKDFKVDTENFYVDIKKEKAR